MTETFRLLDGDGVKDLLGELLERLAARGIAVETYIIGGAAMAIHLGREELTPDIDGLFTPLDEVLAESRAMADEHGLDPEWINGHASPFIAFDPADDVDALTTELRGRPVRVASKRALLAMKIAASRVKDRPDTSRLINDLGITDPEQIVDLAFEVFGDDSVPLGSDRDEVRLIAREAVARARAAE